MRVAFSIATSFNPRSARVSGATLVGTRRHPCLPFQSALRSGERSDPLAPCCAAAAAMFQSALRSGERSDARADAAKPAA